MCDSNSFIFFFIFLNLGNTYWQEDHMWKMQKKITFILSVKFSNGENIFVVLAA